MIITLAYTNTLGLEYDITSALAAGDAVKFDLEVANTSAIEYVPAKQIMNELLDGSIWEVAGAARRKQSFITLPNLLLNTIKVNNAQTTYRDLLLNWYFARGYFINTGDISDPSQKDGLIKVVKTNSLTIDQFNNINWALEATVEFQTAKAY